MRSNIGVEGVAEVIAALKEKSPRIARNLLRSTIQGVASDGAKEVKANAPVLLGELKKSIKAKRLNRKGRDGDIISSAITISAKTVPSVNRPDGTFKWVHIEYGTNDTAADPFVQPVANKIKANLPRILTEQFTKKLAQQVARELRNRS